MRSRRALDGFNGGYGRNDLLANREQRVVKHPVSFALRRSVVVDDSLVDLMTEMKGELGCRYDIFKPESLVATLLGRGYVSRIFGLHSGGRNVSHTECSKVIDSATSALHRPSVDVFGLGRIGLVGANNRSIKLSFVEHGVDEKYGDLYDDKHRLTLGGAQFLTRQVVLSELDEEVDSRDLGLVLHSPVLAFARRKNNRSPSIAEIRDVTDTIDGLLIANSIDHIELGAHRFDLYHGRRHTGTVIV